MKRIGNLYDKICSLENLILAEKKARKGKKKQYGVKLFSRNKLSNLIALHHILVNKQYKIGKYRIFVIYEEKERVIYELPYIDRIVQHAILNVTETIFVKSFTTDTYSCIKKRGIHKASYKLRKALKDTQYKYCLKIDIQKFYPSINNKILKELLKRKFKDADFLNLLFHIINSCEGLPIGNYVSQYLANFYLAYFDHYLKQNKKIRYLFRYCDDIILLAKTKEELYLLLNDIRIYLWNNLRLKLKSNYRIFPTWIGIDFVGYVHYPYLTLLRKTIKLKFIRMLRYNKNQKSISSYWGWLIHSYSKGLIKKYLK